MQESVIFLVGMAVGLFFGGLWMALKWMDYLKDKGDW